MVSYLVLPQLKNCRRDEHRRSAASHAEQPAHKQEYRPTNRVTNTGNVVFVKNVVHERSHLITTVFAFDNTSA